MGSSYSTVEPVAEVDEYVTAKLNGFLPKDFEAGAETDGWKYTYFGLPWKKPKEVPWKHVFAGFTQTEVKVHNARKLQEESNLTTAEFFDKHGFVLLNMPTQVQDWNEDYEKTDTDISKIYHKEVETAIREELFPKGTEFVHIGQDPSVLRRGPESNNNFYGSGVHQDYAYTPEQYMEVLQSYVPDEAAYQKYDQETIAPHLEKSDVFSVVCFWRPINLEDGQKLTNNPIGVLDASSLQEEDIVKTKLFGFSPTGKAMPQLNLKYDEGQRWNFYPDMTNDEVLVLKQLYYKKSDPNAPYKSCFHTAFWDPREEGRGATKRQSTEHRVRIFLK